MKTYYDHDPIWQTRAASKKPVWGSNSFRIYNKVINLLKPLVGEHEFVLDVGCGAGAFGTVVIEHGWDYFGVDASLSAIELGKSAYPDLKLDCQDFVTASLPFALQDDEGFSIVTSINALHCLTETADRNQFLKNIRRSLRQGGVFALTTMAGPVSEDLRSTKIPRAYAAPESIRAELMEAGFRKFIHFTTEPASDFSPIPNLVALVK